MRRAATIAELPSDDALSGQRLDKWLVYARFAKTRGVSQSLVAGGKVRINGQRIVSASRLLRIGDVLTLRLPQAVRVVRVVGFAPKRVSAPQTAELYEPIPDA